MPWVILILIILVIGYIIDWVEKHPPAGTLVMLGLLISTPVLTLAAVRKSRWYIERLREQERKRAEVQAAKDARTATKIAEQIAREQQLEQASLPSAEQFRVELLQKYYYASNPRLADRLLHQIVGVFVSLYKPQTRQHVQNYLSACLTGLTAFTKTIPAICHEPPATASLFSVHYDFGELATYKVGKILHFREEYFDAFRVLVEPFRKQQQALGFMDWSNTSPGSWLAGMGLVPKEFIKRLDAESDDQEKYRPFSMPFNSTPLYAVADAFLPAGSMSVPICIPQDTRYSGMWIVAPPKRGKTTLLTSMIWEDLKLVADNEASIVVLDSKGDLIDTIKHLAIFAPGNAMYGKLVLIEPDPDHPLALNPLDLSDGSEAHLTPGQRKMLANRSVTLLEYLFATMLDGEAGMSGPQSRFFRACMRAILEVIPNPTLHTFYDLLINGYEQYEPYISKLEDRSFFTKEQFYSSTLKSTRESLITRLGLLLDNYAIASMFKSPITQLNLAKEMDSAKVIIINNSKALLEDNGAEFFGRFFLYLLRKAAERRASGAHHVPVFCYIDEAHNVIKRDENIATIVQECRSKNIGMIFAHQALSQIDNDKVRGALADCAIIFANSANEASQLAPRLNAEDPEMLKQPVGTFAAYVRDTADRPLPLKVRMASDLLLMNQRQRDQIRQEMRATYCIGGAGPRRQQQTDAPVPDDPLEDKQDNTPDANFDLHWTITISPRVSEQGGKVKVTDRLTVTIPAGTANGDVLRVKSRGAPKPDGTQGHLLLHIRVPARPEQRGIGANTDRREEWS